MVDMIKTDQISLIPKVLENRSRIAFPFVELPPPRGVGKPHKAVGLGVSAGMKASSARRADCGGGIEVLEAQTL